LKSFTIQTVERLGQKLDHQLPFLFRRLPGFLRGHLFDFDHAQRGFPRAAMIEDLPRIFILREDDSAAGLTLAMTPIAILAEDLVHVAIPGQRVLVLSRLGDG
jgi:hypothetical protein